MLLNKFAIKKDVWITMSCDVGGAAGKKWPISSAEMQFRYIEFMLDN